MLYYSAEVESQEALLISNKQKYLDNISKLSTTLGQISASYQSKSSDLSKKLGRLQAQEATVQQDIRKLHAQLHPEQNQQVENSLENNTCPTCGQGISLHLKSTISSRIRDDLLERQQQLQQIEAAMQQTSSSLLEEKQLFLRSKQDKEMELKLRQTELTKCTEQLVHINNIRNEAKILKTALAEAKTAEERYKLGNYDLRPRMVTELKFVL